MVGTERKEEVEAKSTGERRISREDRKKGNEGAKSTAAECEGEEVVVRDRRDAGKKWAYLKLGLTIGYGGLIDDPWRDLGNGRGLNSSDPSVWPQFMKVFPLISLQIWALQMRRSLCPSPIPPLSTASPPMTFPLRQFSTPTTVREGIEMCKTL